MRFLATLVERRRRYRIDVPLALCRLVDSGRRSIEVSARDAETVAEFVDELVAAGWVDDRDPPVVLSEGPAEEVTIRAEVLVERLPRDGDPPGARVYIAVPARTRGRLLDWERERDRRLAVIELSDRSIVFVSEPHVALPGRRRVY